MNAPRDADFEVDEANMRLVAGLKSCRSVVENYRLMLSGDQEGALDAANSNLVDGFDREEGTAPY
jgi:hypothetical protein